MQTLTRDLGWKLLSLAIAAALWNHYVGETETATSLGVNVQYRGVPANLDITGDAPARIYLHLKGPETRLTPAVLTGTALTLDMSDIHSPGQKTFTITEQQLGLPTGVTLLRSVPSQIHVAIDRRASRLLPVRLQFGRNPPPGYRITSEQVKPPSVWVLGPEQHLAKLESVFTDPLDLSSAVGSAEFHVPVYLSDPQVRLESPSPVSVSLTLEKLP